MKPVNDKLEDLNILRDLCKNIPLHTRRMLEGKRAQEYFVVFNSYSCGTHILISKFEDDIRYIPEGKTWQDKIITDVRRSCPVIHNVYLKNTLPADLDLSTPVRLGDLLTEVGRTTLADLIKMPVLSRDVTMHQLVQALVSSKYTAYSEGDFPEKFTSSELPSEVRVNLVLEAASQSISLVYIDDTLIGLIKYYYGKHSFIDCGIGEELLRLVEWVDSHAEVKDINPHDLQLDDDVEDILGKHLLTEYGDLIHEGI